MSSSDPRLCPIFTRISAVPEQHLLTTINRLLGNNLPDFLLSGLWELKLTHRRAFSTHSTSPQVATRSYQFEIVSQSSHGLSIDWDPLVLAALLDLLCERQPLDSAILFRHSDILDKLQWPHDTESQKLITRAIERYVLTAFCLINPTTAVEDSSGSRYAAIGRLLVGYETTAALLSQKPSTQLPLMRVQCLPALIHDLISERKSFLGIEFQRLAKLVRSDLPQPSREG